jgi:hypothetical protein
MVVLGDTAEERRRRARAVKQIAERYRGLYDRAQLYPSFQPPLDDPRWRTVLSGVERA